MSAWQKLLAWAARGVAESVNVWWREVQINYRVDRESLGFVCVAKWRHIRNETPLGIFGFGQSEEAAAEDCWGHIVEAGIAEEVSPANVGESGDDMFAPGEE